MSLRLSKSVTLLELLISIVLLGMIVLGFSTIELFGRFHALSSDRRAKLQNEASYVLEHMTKRISEAVGSRAVPGQDPISVADIGSDAAITAWIDLNQNGRLEAAPTDRQLAYILNGSSYQMRFYSNYSGDPTSYEVLSQKAYSFTRSVTDNYVELSFTVRWQPAQAASVDNPELSMTTRVKMPQVSSN